jgi:hypothetical protein
LGIAKPKLFHLINKREEFRMNDLADRNQPVSVFVRRCEWGAIWAGVFIFTAIWAVFGTLGMAIFASAAHPDAASSQLGMSVGMGIWAIVLTIIAMYVAGRETGRLAAVETRNDGLIHGMIMFGLSFVAVAILVMLGASSLSGGTGVAGNAHSSSVLTIFTDLGWIGFVALFLGWLAAMWGAASSVSRPAKSAVREIRPAA